MKFVCLDKETLNFIENELHTQYGITPHISSSDLTWEKGDICIAEYHLNKKWYRGRVLQVLDESTVQVLFVDYGNIEDCEIGTLTRDVILRDVPIQSTKCKIENLYPVSKLILFVFLMTYIIFCFRYRIQ